MISDLFCLSFAKGKIRGTPRMQSHMRLHLASIKFLANHFVFNSCIEEEGLPRDMAPALGAGGPEFKSRRPDQTFQIVSRVLH